MPAHVHEEASLRKLKRAHWIETIVIINLSTGIQWIANKKMLEGLLSVSVCVYVDVSPTL